MPTQLNYKRFVFQKIDILERWYTCIVKRRKNKQIHQRSQRAWRKFMAGSLEGKIRIANILEFFYHNNDIV